MGIALIELELFES